jgi:hypothetical protein
MKKRFVEPPAQPTPSPAPPPAAPDSPQLYCGKCGLQQRDPFGTGEYCCANSHVGAPVVSSEQAAVIRARDLGHDVTTPEEAAQHGQPSDAVPLETRVSKPESLTIKQDFRDQDPDRIAQVFKRDIDQAVEKTSRQLDGAMREEVVKEAEKSARSATDWDSAHEPGGSKVDPAWAAIVEKVFVSDPSATYERLEQALVVGDSRTDYGSMMRHLDQAETHARTAHRLWQTAIVERHRWETDNEVIFAAARSEATRALQFEKDQGHRSKMITDADVESKVATLYPDQYKQREAERRKMRAMVDSMQNLAEVWMSRCKTLQVILSKQR